jgi:nucleotide-binding universal stress UspA family protein
MDNRRTYASILVPTDLTKAARDRATLANLLALRFGARLIGAAAEQPVTELVEDTMTFTSADARAQEEHRVSSDLANAESIFHRAIGSGTAAEWRSGTKASSTFLTSLARLADLIIVGRQAEEDDQDFNLGAAPSDLVMQLGRPMLIVPPTVRQLEADRIVVAWKDTREARRAVIDALPFLQRAEDVIIVAVGGGRTSAEDVVRHLGDHHVIRARVIEVTQVASVFSHLLEVSDGEGADLIVAGAYGHSRMRELVLGGVTEEILKSTPACCLLSH